jgi:ParB/RepB/Spo0J family partition protein
MRPRIEAIPLGQFDLSLSGMRIMNMTRVLQVEKSMRLHGQLQPVIARVHREGVQLIDGFKRLYSAESLMIETLQCRLLDIDLAQAKVLLMSCNRIHQSMEALEEALVLQDLQKTHSLDQRSLARMTGHSPSWVSRRLSLIGKMDEQVSYEIRLGGLTSSHARALVKLPRGNQADVARVITDWHLTSRQSSALVDAFLEAKDGDTRQYILSHPELVLEEREPVMPEEVNDDRLTRYGNDLMKSMELVLYFVQITLSRLGDHRLGELNDTEKVIIAPVVKKVSKYTEKLTGAITRLQIHKTNQ